MRRSYVYQTNPETGEVICYEKGNEPQKVSMAPIVIPDIAGYKSMKTGEWISSRSHHRDHLKQHGLIEIGTDTSHMKQRPKEPDRAAIRRDIIEAVKRYS